MPSHRHHHISWKTGVHEKKYCYSRTPCITGEQEETTWETIDNMRSHYVHNLCASVAISTCVYKPVYVFFFYNKQFNWRTKAMVGYPEYLKLVYFSFTNMEKYELSFSENVFVVAIKHAGHIYLVSNYSSNRLRNYPLKRRKTIIVILDIDWYTIFLKLFISVGGEDNCRVFWIAELVCLYIFFTDMEKYELAFSETPASFTLFLIILQKDYAIIRW